MPQHFPIRIVDYTQFLISILYHILYGFNKNNQKLIVVAISTRPWAHLDPNWEETISLQPLC